MQLFTIEHAEAINDSSVIWLQSSETRSLSLSLCRVPSIRGELLPVASARPNDSISARRIRPDVNWMIELSNASGQESNGGSSGWSRK